MRTEFPEEEMLDRSFRDKVFRARGGGGGKGIFQLAAFFCILVYIQMDILLENSVYIKPTYSLSIILDLVSFSSCCFFSVGLRNYNPL